MSAKRRPDYGETLYCVEYAKSNRSTCKASGLKIEKDELRIGSIVPGEGDYDMTSWRKLEHQKVPLVVSEEETWTDASQIFGFDELPPDGQKLVKSVAPPVYHADSEQRDCGSGSIRAMAHWVRWPPPSSFDGSGVRGLPTLLV